MFMMLLAGLTRMFVHAAEFVVYIWIYNNYRVVDIPWNSPWGWLLCFLGVDLGYYWFHRLAHEVNFMWAAHQVHHSSEDYNLGTALRQSILQRYTSWIFYVPMALFVSPSTAFVHIQFNTLYQFWIHTELITSLGPLGYILNTPSHHRVHHGRNPYCIDKNYAGTLIIWDRIFGTFEPEKVRIVYGLVHPIASWDPIYIQFCHLMHMWNMFCTLPGLGNKLSVVFKGPGWEPGKPRCGLIEDLPKVKYPEPRYDSRHSSWADGYLILHFALLYLLLADLSNGREILLQSVLFCTLGYMILSLTSFGAICDKKPYAALLEFIRCALYLLCDATLTTPVTPLLGIGQISTKAQIFNGIFTVSAIVWCIQGIREYVSEKAKIQ
ncbi:alkylglycerol monooxygenase-like [Saccoglossus kowalevskii]